MKLNQLIKGEMEMMTLPLQYKKIIVSFIIVIGAVIFSTAPLWHIYFKNNEIKTLVKDYKELQNKVISSNKIKSDLIIKLNSEPDNKLILQDLFKAQNEYQKHFETATNAYQNYVAKKATKKIMFFPDTETLVYNLGIGFFLIYVSMSFITFYINRKSKSQLYLHSIKIKTVIIASGAIYFIAYSFYPGYDFENYIYLILGSFCVIISIYFSILFSKYIRNLEDEINIANTSIVNLIKLIGRVKIKHIFPFVRMANKVPEINKNVVDNNLNELDTDIKETLKSIA